MTRMSSEKARNVRQQGHKDALEFAQLIGLEADYSNDPQAKKDVIDRNGDAHSVKSGQKKWQIFLYKKSRFEDDPAFDAMNGIGDIIKKCFGAFPTTHEEYKKNKKAFKNALRPHMRALKEKLSEKARLRTFFEKSFFNGNEVRFLTIKHNGVFHVFQNSDVVKILSQCIEVRNSIAKTHQQTSEQKTVFCVDKTIGEIEMRSDAKHYIAIKFWMFKEKTLKLLQNKSSDNEQWGSRVIVYGNAIKKFKKIHKEHLMSCAN